MILARILKWIGEMTPKTLAEKLGSTVHLVAALGAGLPELTLVRATAGES